MVDCSDWVEVEVAGAGGSEEHWDVSFCSPCAESDSCDCVADVPDCVAVCDVVEFERLVFAADEVVWSVERDDVDVGG